MATERAPLYTPAQIQEQIAELLAANHVQSTQIRELAGTNLQLSEQLSRKQQELDELHRRMRKIRKLTRELCPTEES